MLWSLSKTICKLLDSGEKPTPERYSRTDELRVSTGLTLRRLILESNSDNTDILKNDLTFLEPDSLSKLQKVAADDGAEHLVYIEYKSYELPARRPNDKLTVQRACNLARLLRHPNA